MWNPLLFVSLTFTLYLPQIYLQMHCSGLGEGDFADMSNKLFPLLPRGWNMDPHRRDWTFREIFLHECGTLCYREEYITHRIINAEDLCVKLTIVLNKYFPIGSLLKL
jgi:hypothetical protein